MSFADPISNTARLTAAARARESRRPDRLFEDPWAEALAGPEGAAFMEKFEAAARPPGAPSSTENPYIAIRTRALDDFLLAEVGGDRGPRQVVLSAAGLDTRAFRLAWPVDTRLFELDRPDVLAAKQAVLDRAGAVARCDRRALGVDLGGPWAAPLIAGGFHVGRPSVWLVEGLLPYVDEAGARHVLTQAAALAAPGSRMAADVVGKSFLESPYTRAYLEMMARENAPWRFGTDDPEAFWAATGWDATAKLVGAEGLNFGRWPFPPFPRGTPGVPHSFVVTATRT